MLRPTMLYQSASLSAFLLAVFWSGVRQLVDEKGAELAHFDADRPFPTANGNDAGGLWQRLEASKQSGGPGELVTVWWEEMVLGLQQILQLDRCGATAFLKELHAFIERCVSNNSVMLALSGLPYCVVCLLQLLSNKDRLVPAKREKRFKDPDRPPVFYKPEKPPISLGKGQGIRLDIPQRQEDNRHVEENIKQRVLELEVMAKTVEYLQRKCRLQENQLQKRGSELEEMARTVEYLQRPGGTKALVGLMNRVYHSTFPALPNMGYYKLQVPVDREERLCSGSVEDLREESEASDTPSGTELEWDAWA